MPSLIQQSCKPCEGGMPPLKDEALQSYMAQISPQWHLVHTKNIIVRVFVFNTFLEGIAFVNQVADLAEKEGHHPDITIHYTKISLSLSTHAISGLSENDFILAAKIDLFNTYAPI